MKICTANRVPEQRLGDEPVCGRCGAELMSAQPVALTDTTLPPFVSAVEGRLMMALKFFELGRLSLGQAAEVAGYSKRAFIDVLGQYGIPVADYPASELANEVAW